jgi:hypothetical protein
VEVVKVKRALIFGLLASLVASSALAAYVVILRSGGRIVAREKYQVKGASAVITLKNGTLSSIPLSQIDVDATEKLNARNLGDAVPLDWIDPALKPVPTATPTPKVARLGFIKPGLATPEAEANRPTPTPGVQYRDGKYRDQRVVQVFEQTLEAYHLYLYRTSEGTRPGYLFIEISVNGQPEAFKALQAVCVAYHMVVEDLTKKNEAARIPEFVETQMLNEAGREAGVFRLSPSDAAELATGKATAENFFVQHVIF